MSGLAVLFLLFDSVIHMMKIAPVVDGFAQLGIPWSRFRPRSARAHLPCRT